MDKGISEEINRRGMNREKRWIDSRKRLKIHTIEEGKERKKKKWKMKEGMITDDN